MQINSRVVATWTEGKGDDHSGRDRYLLSTRCEEPRLADVYRQILFLEVASAALEVPPG